MAAGPELGDGVESWAQVSEVFRRQDRQGPAIIGGAGQRKSEQCWFLNSGENGRGSVWGGEYGIGYLLIESGGKMLNM